MTFGHQLRDTSANTSPSNSWNEHERNVSLSDIIFQPNDTDVQSERSEQRLVVDKTKEVWQQAKPFITDSFYLKQGQNSPIHENAFWEQHAYIGIRQDKR